MTLENRLKRYKHYIDNKLLLKAKELSDKYPDVLPKPVEKPKPIKKAKE